MQNIRQIKNEIFLRTFLLLVFIVTIIAAVIGYPLYTSWQEKNLKEIDYIINAEQLSVEQYISKLVTVTEQITTRTKARLELESFNTGEIDVETLNKNSRKFLIDAKNTSEKTQGITRLDIKGNPVIIVGQELPEGFLNTFDHTLDKTIVHKPIYSNDKVYVIVSTSVRAPKGKKAGVDLVLFNINELQTIIKKNEALGETFVTYLDEENNLKSIFPSRHKLSMDGFQDIRAKFLNNQLPKDHFFHEECSDCIVAIRSIKDTEWNLFLKVISTDLNALLNEMITKLILVSIFILVVGLLALYFFSVPLFNSLEKALLERDKANAVQKAKSEFVANMSHEIRTPMNSVLGFLKIVLDNKELPYSLRSHLNTAYNSASSLLGIINDILDVSKLESNKISLELICVNLTSLIKESIKIVQHKADEKDLKIKFEYDSSLPHCHLADPTRLRQVILNIIGNSIKFTDKGDITIKVSKTKVEDLLEFSIKDTGIGMSKDQIDKVFEPFTQADNTTTRKYGGTGLGTTISKNIIELMGGEVWVESKLGVGTTFYFTAKIKPADCSEDCMSHGITDTIQKIESKRIFDILLVDDIEENIELAKFRLEEQGHKVDCAENGKIAIEKWEKKDYDLILMDIQMPELDGVSATKIIREKEKENHTFHTCIIALTASVTQEQRNKFFDVGMDSFVAKPIDFDYLFETIEKSVASHLGKENKSINVDLSQKTDIDLSTLSHITNLDKALDIWKDSKIYLNSLKSFASKHIDDAKKIEEFLNNKEIEEAHNLSHALKGLSGNLVLLEISKLVTKINDSIKLEQFDKALEFVPLLDKSLNNAVSTINSLEEPEVKKLDSKEFNKVEVEILFSKLLEALHEDNPDPAEEILEKLDEYLSSDSLEKIRKNIDDFDFRVAEIEAKNLYDDVIKDN